ncbi:MAG: 3-isopropylmalate dehydratase small subunit [Actinomycetota bacterium]
MEELMEPVRLVSGKVSVLDRADVDTDQIIPKQFLKRIERTGYGEFLFYDWVRSGEVTVEANPILAAGRNFGCGSSREHAVWAIQQFGFGAVVAPSFGDIFYGNCTKNGLLPVLLPEADVRALMAAGEATIDLAAQTVSFAGRSVPFEIDADIKHRLLNGLDEIGLTMQYEAEISAFERDRLPAGPVTTAL